MEGAASTTPQGYTNGSQHPVTAPTVASAQEETVTPPKRKPGRPKGSGKKQLLTTGEPKVKRPVGRPRKDGLPAGSLGVVKRPTIRRSSTDATYEPIASSSQGFAQWRNVNTDASEDSQHRSSKRPTSLAFETSQEVDEWAELLQSRPNIFLANLLSSLSAPNPISSAGPSVEEAFKSNLVSLSSAQAKVTQSIPSLYSILKTFWLPSSPAYFSLTASASTARTPPEHRFLYWDPQPLVFNGIPCPVCSSPLAHKGRIRSGPIKVYDLDKPFFIIGCEYVCKSGTCTASTSPEGRKFASTDPSILRSLPAKLKDEFPAYLLQGENDSGSGANIWCWKPMGVSRSLWNMVKGGLKMGLNKEVIIRLVRSIQNGVPDETTQREEEEEEVDAEQVEDEITEGIYNHLAEHQAAVDDSFEDKSALNETYADAWRANAATVPATTPPSAKLSVLEPEPRATPTPTPTPVAQPALTPTPTPPVPAASNHLLRFP
ncbi:hypothetical protein ONZ45_g16925 [Pleurotus djamor]|nr:hypothetical protein ONZ45_g16925 [Pleurotus djamor]